MYSILPIFWKAFLLTLQVSAIGILGATFIGFFLAIILYYRIPYLYRISRVYIEISRNTPLLIQLFFLYFGLGVWVNISNFWCAIFGVIFLGASYMAESFRLGLQQVHKIQIEQALSLGFSRLQILRFIILPQSIGVSMPAICANILFLIKETSIVGAIALPDIMAIAKEIIGIYSQTNEALFLLIVAYLIMLLPLSFIFMALEKYCKRIYN
ncbi:amino acid ABC transporter permease [Helicobacter aurati]|uniref:Amino acid ABC transporter permease n=1 Tax=Helicobacter aurati TaxID=137778 RepID=A0A3D8J221_9HELI|nr:amino acid ABC transporter permease [Helicobacter aurati]